jgi:hypothetical protein
MNDGSVMSIKPHNPDSIADFLVPTEFVDSDHAAIKEVVSMLHLHDLAPRERASTAFRFVRDEIIYKFGAKERRDCYVASNILKGRTGFCIQKAILLAALGRAAAIPTALVYCDYREQTLHPSMVKTIGTDTMYYHGYVAFHLDGEWRSADATFSPDIAEKNNYVLVQFDGTGDGLLSPVTTDGKPHAEYLRTHGFFVDFPFEQMLKVVYDQYKDAGEEALLALGFGRD